RQTGHSVATAVTQQVTFVRTAIIDKVTGALLGYDTTGDGQVDTSDADEAWRIEGSNQLATVVSPDLVADGYQAADPQSVNALTLTNSYSGDPAMIVNVYYDHATLPVTPTTPGQPGQPINPNEPNGPKWPAGTDQADLSKTVTRTINYLDRQTGHSVATAVPQQVTFVRTAIID
ncbi:mucin-binding protein, partial [Furfurilactobacillus curtus]|uniref:mucin-binding protein n=1 Tax=Furfurilactobacillus curtus TaxID=1746200 RepID=UPI0038B2DDE6